MVFAGGLSPGSEPWPPTKRSFGVPAPFSPWHAWHFAMYTASPCFTVPLPGGRPAPSGPMLMSQEARSSGEIGLPRLGLCWAATGDASARRRAGAAATKILRIDIFHLAIAGHGPGLDHVVVVNTAVAAQRDELRAGRLDVTSLVGGAALQHRGAAVPLPCHTEPRRSLRQHWLLQRRLAPALAAVGRYLNLGNLAVARPGEARNLIKARPTHRQPWRRMGDDRLRLQWEYELQRFPGWQQDGVLGGLVLGHGRALGELDPPEPLDVHVALKTGQQQAHRVAVRRAHALTVLVEADHGVIERLLYGEAAAHAGSIGAFRQNPLGRRLDTGRLQEHREHDTGPFGARQQAVDRLDVRGCRLFSEQRAAVAGAFHECDARLHRIAAEIVEGEHQRALHQAVDDQAMRIRTDVRNAAVAALVVQAARSDHAVEQMMRGARGAGAAGARRRSPGAGDLFLVFRRLTVTVERRARNFHPGFHHKRRRTGLIDHGARTHRGSATGKKHTAMQKPVAGHMFDFAPRRSLHAQFLPAHIALRTIVVRSGR